MKKQTLVLAGGGILLGLCIGAVGTALMLRVTSPSVATELHDQQSKYPYVNPLLACGDFKGPLPQDVQAAQSDIQDIIKKHTADGSVREVSVYFRDLHNGPWFGINEAEKFTPGSLLKVPLMMAYLKFLSSDPALAQKKIPLVEKQEQVIAEVAPSQANLVVGQSYTADQLLAATITESDNDAALLLYQLIGTDRTDAVFTELGIAAPQGSDPYSISVRQYASFFRILFNATYLSASDSERALELLAQAKFTRGLVAGVPSGVAVAHKFGERETPDQLLQLHDCGIVYAANDPYILCVMTRGTNQDALESVISEVSHAVYTNVVQ